MAFRVGDEVVHRASGEKGVVVAVLGGSGQYTVSYGYRKSCDCNEEALELADEET